MELETKFTLAQILASDNLAEDFSEKDLETIGATVVRTYDLDKRSRYEWEVRNETALKLALQVVEHKTFPWPDASNVKFPLLTIAALQYHARSYPALIPGTSIVKCRVFGDDTDGTEALRARRIETHMSYQLLEEDENWEDEMDKVLITQPIIGCAFKKSYYDPIKESNISENIFAKDLVVDYYTKSLETAQRITHVLALSSNYIKSRVAKGLYRDCDLFNPVIPTTDILTSAKDQAQGVFPTGDSLDKPFDMLEQHCWMDLDQDGYKEPYVVLVHKDTGKVLRIVARFYPSGVSLDDEGNVISIQAENFFTKFSFIPSPDGGFYDLGFGVLLSPLNESINTLINQLIDAGTMSNTGGGFLARGVKLRGGNYAFSPNEWKPVESTGDDLRKGIFPLPVREPSQVLFTLLSLLIDYGERIGGAVDILTGQNPGQNTPAETSRNMAEQGMKIFNGIFKRTYRGLKSEFRKLYRLNQLNMIDDVQLGDMTIPVEDYNQDSKAIVPAADPNMISDSQRVQQAATLMEMANNSPGFNVYEVQKRMLKALKVDDIEKVLPDPAGPNAIPQQPHYKVQEAQVKAQAKMQEVQAKVQMAIAKMQQEADKIAAEVSKLEAETVKLKVEAAGVDAGHQIAKIQLELQARKQHQEGILASLQLMKDIEKEKNQGVEMPSSKGE